MMSRALMKIEWDEKEARKLERALASRPDALGYCELAGFFFALACAPQLVKPREWLPLALGEELPKSDDEARALIELVMTLYNHINLQVLEREPALPAGVEVRVEPMENFGPQAPLGRWAGGFGAGQLLTEDVWPPFVDEAPDPETLDTTLGGLNVALTFFTSRELARKWLRKMAGKPTLEAGARRALDALPVSMKALAELGRGLEDARRARERGRTRSAKVGRNESCPCGSGRKYKHCCGRGPRG
jgi:uncharacterized protein